MKRRRDATRNRFYRAEDEALQYHAQKNFPTIMHIDDYVRKTVLRDKWFKRTFGYVQIRVEKARGGSTRSSAGVDEKGRYIRLVPIHYIERIVLHEIAHEIRPLTGWAKCVPGQATHGREYAQTLLLLVQHFMGAEAAKKLRDSFRKHKIKYTQPRQISEDQKATLRRRLALYRMASMALTLPTSSNRRHDHASETEGVAAPHQCSRDAAELRLRERR